MWENITELTVLQPKIILRSSCVHSFFSSYEKLKYISMNKKYQKCYLPLEAAGVSCIAV